MPQAPTAAQADVMKRAMGLDDFDSVVGMKDGFAPFALNLMASSDTWTRRPGRDFFLLAETSGAVLGMDCLRWDDETSTEVGQIGASFYDLEAAVTYLIGARLIFQSSALDWWNCTPDPNTGLITPTVVADPVTYRTGNLTVLPGETIAAAGIGEQAIRLVADVRGWWTESVNYATAVNSFASDLAFSYASGYSLIIKDDASNAFRFSITDDGNLITTT